jgi:uncharacterized protein (TIGR02391 family)
MCLHNVRFLVDSLATVVDGILPTPDPSALFYDSHVADPDLRRYTAQLFYDEHYARAVEEAYKYVELLVRNLSGSSADGADLMRHSFSPSKPVLRLNSLKTKSEQNEQKGYMDIYAGCMMGIRNPRAHDPAWSDSPSEALVLLTWADYLIRRVKCCIK